MKRDVFDALNDRRQTKQPTALASALDGSWQVLLGENAERICGDELPDGWSEEVAQALRDDRSSMCRVGDVDAFVQVFNPPLRLIIVGAVHIAQHLCVMASVTGYDVVVVDPRRSFAADERFPAVTMYKVWPDDALRELRLDRRTAVVTLTHDPKIDDPALDVALDSDVFYIGSLGSRRTHAARCERLRERGTADSALARIHAPVGLDIGARSPAEIAVSVLAQVTAALHGKTSH
jgi:xanthine dehydrogenase accessory factor